MKRTENPELRRLILDHLADLYKIKEIREPNHLSSYVYCLTKGFLDQKQAILPTDDEVMMFAIGYGLQDVLTPGNTEEGYFEREGIIYRPDMLIPKMDIDRQQELKTTRKSAKKHFIDEEIPETWLAYMKGGCYIRDNSKYDLIVLYLMGNYSPPFPQLYADTFEFADEEIANNWQTLIGRKEVLDDALADGKPPQPFKYCYNWECQYCRYKLVCETLSHTLYSSEEPVARDVVL